MPKKFNEFLQEKAKTAVVADYNGPTKTAPPGGGPPYQAKGKTAKGKGGDWTAKGSQPEYKPGKTKAGKKAEQIKEATTFVDKTKNMSPKKFLEYMKKTSKNAALIHETAQRTSRVLKENQTAHEALIRETKRNGTFRRLVVEMLGHEEFFETMAMAMGSKNLGQSVCRKLAKAMHEMVGGPPPDAHQPLPLKAGLKKGLHGHPDDEDEDDDDMMGGGDEDDAEGADDDMSMGGPDDDMDDDDMSMGGPDDMGDDMGMGGPMDGGPHDMDDDGMGGPDDMGGLGHPLSHLHSLGQKLGKGPMGGGMGDDMGGPGGPGMGGPGAGMGAGGPMGSGMGLDDEPGMGDDDSPFAGGGPSGFGGGGDPGDEGDDDSPFGGSGSPFGDDDDDDSLEDKHKDDADDDEHDDDEDDDEDGEDDDDGGNPFGGDDKNPFKKKSPGKNPDSGKPNPFAADGPKPSMMSRMMRREHVTPAQRNFMKAFRQY